MTGRDVLTTRIGGTVKVEIRGIANYGNVTPYTAPDGANMFVFSIASGRSGSQWTERKAINSVAAHIRLAERKRITDIVRDKASMPEFAPNDLDYSADNGFTIDGEPWEQWLDAMTQD